MNWLRPLKAIREFREVRREVQANSVWLRERIAQLELALEDQGWIRTVIGAEREFSREGLSKIIEICRIAYLKNPLINRAVSVQAFYVFGQGMTIGCSKDPDANDIVQEFLDDPQNRVELTSHQARTMKEVDLECSGNIFFVFFSNPSTGKTIVRTIPVQEIQGIITNPEDSKDPWFYKRIWTESGYREDGQPFTKSREVLYPALGYREKAPDSFARLPVARDYPVYHVKVGGFSDMRFGVPEVYSAVDWARAYKEFLEDWSSIVRAYARFAWALKTPGGARGVAAAKTKLATTIGGADLTNVETNPPPVSASAFLHDENTSLTPIRTAGATTSADDARRLLLMVCAATGKPETFFGDVSVGTLATARSLDRPTELQMIDRQTLWRDVFKDILGFVLSQADKADAEVSISFPSILEHDMEQQLRAIVSGATLDGKPPAGTIDSMTLSRMILTALGDTDVEQTMTRLFPEGASPESTSAAEAKLAQSVAGLRTAVLELAGKNGR